MQIRFTADSRLLFLTIPASGQADSALARAQPAGIAQAAAGRFEENGAQRNAAGDYQYLILSALLFHSAKTFSASGRSNCRIGMMRLEIGLATSR